MGNSVQLSVQRRAEQDCLKAGCILLCILAALILLVLPVSADPTAKFSVSATSGYIPLTVKFTQSSTCDSSPCTYEWNFDDGNDSYQTTKTTFTHKYTDTGSYTVTLTVTNNNDETDTATKTITAKQESPSADFDSDVTSGPLPLTVSFTDTSSGDPTTWNWTFGDGNTSTDQDPDHTYAYAGKFTVTLKVSNDAGYDTISKKQYISVGKASNPTADFDANQTSGEAPLDIKFTDTSKGYPDTWKWTFGDGESSTDQNPVHEYSDSGTYTVTLKVSNDEGSDTMTKTGYVTVGTLPVVAFVASATSGSAPLTVTFTDSTKNDPTGWYWTFGDGDTSSVQNPSHTYMTPGTYSVTLKAINTAGSATLTKPGMISIGGQATTVPTTVPTTARITTRFTTRVPIEVTTTAEAAGEESWLSLPVIAIIIIIAIVIVGVLVLRGGRRGRGRWDL